MKNKLKMAEIYLDKAKTDWSKRHVDDEFVDTACIDLMFSIECAIKYLISLEGKPVPRTHFLKELLSDLPIEYYESDWYTALDKWKKITDTWYSDSRYNDTFSAVNEIVDDYLIACEKLISDASNSIKYTCTIESRVQKVLNKLNSTKTVSEVLKFLPSCDVSDDVLFSLVTEILRDKLSKRSTNVSGIMSAIDKMSG